MEDKIIEINARFELLKLELGHIQDGIRGIDGILFQIKGWCVTLSVAISGFAVSTREARLVAVASVGVIGFWLVEAHFKSVQRVFINRDGFIEQVLSESGPLEALNDGRLKVPGVASGFQTDEGMGWWATLRHEAELLWREAQVALVFGFYLLLMGLLGVLALTLSL